MLERERSKWEEEARGEIERAEEEGEAYRRKREIQDSTLSKQSVSGVAIVK